MIGEYLEQYTFDFIMSRALARVSDSMDKRQGSIIYDALAPAVQELAEAYVELRNARRDISVETATGEALTELAHQVGVDRYLATKAIRRGSFSAAVPIGSRFSIEDVIFSVMSNIENFDYQLECETAGTIGNQYYGALTPITNVTGIETANLTDIIKYGTDEELDDPLRIRYKQRISNPPQDGNAAQYQFWSEEYGNIGACKILPLWNGGNSVKIVITNKVYEPASAELIADFQDYMDPGSLGLGEGKAPVGSKVTVVSGSTKPLDISGQVVLADGYTMPEGVQDAITEYLRSITFKKAAVSYIRVVNAVLNCSSVEDVISFTINSGTTDISLTDIDIPVISNFNVTGVI